MKKIKKSPLHIDIVTVLPKLLESPFQNSIVKRGIDKKLVKVNVINLRDYASDKYKTTDDYLYGGGAGMVMMIEPIVKCIESLKKTLQLRSGGQYDEIIYMSPDGELFDQKMANNLSMQKNLILLCGHYKGIDERVREHFITKEISIGDYVLSGGELPAAVVCDAVIRLIPGVISDETSALTDSFQDRLLSPPAYTRPADYKGMKVPDILLSGNTRNVEEWRHERSVERTEKRRPRLMEDGRGKMEKGKTGEGKTN
ncbi:MAG: tRNA (guanosine(37)-N1)-methyltransferase TrmD [Bacteroidetes bacterium]|nr:MAG: tRNA (guanosine(37)-N1)-methyltransferase TrmD [Bacteroidota bacterium]